MSLGGVRFSGSPFASSSADGITLTGISFATQAGTLATAPRTKALTGIAVSVLLPVAAPAALLSTPAETDAGTFAGSPFAQQPFAATRQQIVIQIALTGVPFTVQSGTLFENNVNPLTGVVASFAQGNETVSRTRALTGIAVTFTQGTESAAQRLTGLAATTAIGSVRYTRPLVGQSSAFNQGTEAVTRTRVLTGSLFASTTGTLVEANDNPLTGIDIAAEGGSLSSAQDLSGSSFDVQNGDVVALNAEPMTGASSAVQAGSIDLRDVHDKVLTGSSFAATLGNLVELNAEPQIGITSAFQQGTLAKAVARAVAGMASTSQLGTINNTNSAVLNTTSYAGRASVATYLDAADVLQTAAIDELRYVGGQPFIEDASTNEVLNSRTNWSLSYNPNSVVRTANYGTTPDGATNAATRFTRTGGAGSAVFNFGTGGSPAMVSGTTKSGSFWINLQSVMSGTWSFSVYFGASTSQYGKYFNLSVSNGQITSINNGGSVYTGINGWQRISFPNVTATGDFSGWDFVFSVPGDFDILLWQKQMEPGATVTSDIFTAGSAVTRDADMFAVNRNSVATYISNGMVRTAGANQSRIQNGVLLLENAATNRTRNSMATGATAGATGTLPSLWSGGLGLTNGITRRVAAVGVDSGLPYIDFEFTGTATSTFNIFYNTDDLNTTPTTVGDVWVSSIYSKLVSGTIPAGTLLTMHTSGRFSGGEETNSANLNVGTGNLLDQRAFVSRSISNPATVTVGQYLRISFASGTTYNYTLRIAGPQLESGTVPTSFIPTSGAVATRDADVLEEDLYIGTTTGSAVANTSTQLLSGLRVLGWQINPSSHILMDYITSRGALVTYVSDLTTIPASQVVGAYDLVVADAAVWGATTAIVAKLKEFVDAGVPCLGTGNDTRTNVFVASYTTASASAHNLVKDPAWPTPITGSTLGNIDLLGGIATLQNGAVALYDRSDTGLISGYVYTGTSGASLYWDQEALSSYTGPFAQAGINFVLQGTYDARSISMTTGSVTNVLATELVGLEATSDTGSFGVMFSDSAESDSGAYAGAPFAGVSFAYSPNVTKLAGQTINTTAGSMVESNTQPQTGISATVAQGALGKTRTRGLTGQSFSTQIGNIIELNAEPMTGIAISTQAGTIRLARPLTGSEFDVQIGSVVELNANPLTGVAITAQDGDVARASFVAGSEISIDAGAATNVLTQDITGLSISAQSNSLDLADVHQKTLTGSAISTQTGDVTNAFTRPATGSVISVQTGTVAKTLARSVSGIAITAQQQPNITERNDEPMSGSQMSMVDGDVLASQSLTGVLIAASTGSINNVADADLSSQTVSVLNATLRATNLESLSGVSITAQQQTNITENNLEPLTGIAVITQSGTVRTAQSLSGSAFVAQEGDVATAQRLSGAAVSTQIDDLIAAQRLSGVSLSALDGDFTLTAITRAIAGLSITSQAASLNLSEVNQKTLNGGAAVSTQIGTINNVLSVGLKTDRFVSRASIGTYFDAGGVLQTAAVDQARPNNDVSTVRTNYILHSNLKTGATWWYAGAVATHSVDNTTTDPFGGTGARKFVVTTSGAIRFGTNSNHIVNGANNSPFSGSLYIKSADGLVHNTGCFLDLNDLSTAGSFIVDTNWKRVGITAQRSGVDYRFLDLNLSPGEYHVYGVQLEPGNSVTEWIPTTTTPVSRDATSNGQLLEAAATNYVPNNTMVGAAAGVAPTGWSMGYWSVVRTGVEDGIEYVDVRINRTNSTAGLEYGGITIAVPATKQGDVWTASAYIRQIGGSTAGLVWNAAEGLRLREQGGAINQHYGVNPLNVGNGPLNKSRLTVTGTVAQSDTTTMMLNFQLPQSAGATVDCTFRIGLPQLERGSIATSPIKTSGVNASRAADRVLVSRNSVATFIDSDGTLVYVDTDESRIENGQLLVEDAATNKRFHSNTFSNSLWVKGNSSITSATGVTAPDGTTAWQFAATASFAQMAQVDMATTAGEDWWVSVFVKKNDAQYFTIVQEGWGSAYTAVFDLNNGTHSGTNTVRSIQKIGDGWYRVAAKFIVPAGQTTFRPKYWIGQYSGTNYTPASVYLFGAQAERTNLTSYIPTDAAYVTREADVYGTDLSVSFSSGAVTNAVARGLSGQQITSARGNIVELNAQPQTGIAATFATGNVDVLFSDSAASDEGMFAGAPFAGVSFAYSPYVLKLAGIAIGTQAGALVENNVNSLTGVATTIQIGNIIELNANPLTGVSITTQGGSVVELNAQPLSGSVVATQAGAIRGAQALDGHSFALQTGNITEKNDQLLTGTVVAAQTGSLNRATDIDGTQFVVSTGNVTNVLAKGLTGVSASVLAASLNLSEVNQKALTGSSTTAQAGVINNTLARALTGAAVATQIGSVAKDSRRDLPSNTLSVQTGTAKADNAQPLSGIPMFPQDGSIAGVMFSNPASSDAGTFAGAPFAGAAFADSSNIVTLIGSAVSTQTGTLRGSQALTGVQFSTQIGNLVEKNDQPLTGIAIAVQRGNIVELNVNPLTGIALFPQTGSVRGAQSLTGSAFAAQFGSLVEKNDQPLTGMSMSAGSGDVAQAVTSSLTGEDVFASHGNINNTVTRGLTGTSSSFALGTINNSATRSLFGAVATTTTGNAIYTQRIAGVVATFDDGAIAFTRNLSGQFATSQIGNVKGVNNEPLSGISAAIQAGFVAAAQRLSGAAVTSQIGNFVETNANDLTGISISTQTGAPVVLLSAPAVSDHGAYAGAPFMGVTNAGNRDFPITLASLSGEDAAFSQSTLTKSVARALSGAAFVVSHGDIVNTASKALTGLIDVVTMGGVTNKLWPSVVDAVWTRHGSIGEADFFNYGIAPDGTQTTYLTQSNTPHRYRSALIYAGIPNTYSIFVKCAPTDGLRIYADGNLGVGNTFKSANATFATTNSTPSLGGVAAAASCTPVAGFPGWYRLSLTYVPEATGQCNHHVYPLTSNPQEWWGAQVELGVIAGEYVPTTTGFASVGPIIPAQALAGLDVASQSGSIIEANDEPLTGQEISGQQGTAKFTLPRALTGVAITSQRGNIVARNDEPLTGASSATQSGVIYGTQKLTGQAISGSTGSILELNAKTLMGATVAVQSGEIISGQSISGEQIDSQSGSFDVLFSSIATSDSGAFAGAPFAGTAFADSTGVITMASVAVLAQTGALTYERPVSLTGETIATVAGDFEQSGSRALTGIASPFQTGNIVELRVNQLTGSAASTQTGVFYGSQKLTGSSISIQSGGLAKTCSVTPTGQSFTATRGSIQFAARSFSGTSSTIQTGALSTLISSPASSDAGTFAGAPFAGAAFADSSGVITIGNVDSVSAQAGTLVFSYAVSLTGAQVDSSSGFFIEANNRLVSGASFVTQTGTLSRAITASINGVEIATQNGSINAGQAVAGVSAALSTGVVAKVASRTLSGLLRPLNTGSLSAAQTLTGTENTFQTGTLSVMYSPATNSDSGTFAGAPFATKPFADSTGIITIGNVGAISAQTGATIATSSRALSGAAISAQMGVFGKTVIKSLSGLSIPAQTGTLNRTNSSALTGTAATVDVGSINGTQILTGVSVSSQSGALIKSTFAFLSGRSITTTAGTAIAGQAITGTNLAIQSGTINVLLSSPASDDSGTFAGAPFAGSPFAGSTGVITIGNLSAMSAQLGTVIPGQFVVGAAIPFQQGTLAMSITRALSGASFAAQIGNVTDSLAGILSGQVATTLSGSSSVVRTLSLSGQAVATQMGTLDQNEANVHGLTGQSFAGETGSVAATNSVATTGLSFASQNGNVSYTQRITGVSVAISITKPKASNDKALNGITLSIATSDIQDAPQGSIRGSQIAVSTGTMLASPVLHNETMLAQTGTISFVPVQNLSGSEITSSLGTTNVVRVVSLQGQQVDITDGEFTVDFKSAITGAQLNGLIGNIDAVATYKLAGASVQSQIGSLGKDATIELRGVEIASQNGTVNFTRPIIGSYSFVLNGSTIAANSQKLAGMQIAGAQGSFGKTSNNTITGNGMTSIIGNVVALNAETGIGQRMDSATGKFIISRNVELFGQPVTGYPLGMEIGELLPLRTMALIGSQMGAQIGNIAEINKNTLGTQVSFSGQGSLGQVRSKALTGEGMALAQANVDFNDVVSDDISGQSMAMSIGSVAVSRPMPLNNTGIYVTFHPGQLTPVRGLTGASFGAAIGSLKPLFSYTISQSAAFGTGSLGMTRSVGLTGIGTKAYTGFLIPATAAKPVGQSIPATAGFVWRVIDITGVGATAVNGQLNAARALALTGVSTVAETGLVGDIKAVRLSGVQIASVNGSVGKLVEQSINGGQMSMEDGQLVKNVTFGLTGKSLAVQAGSILATPAIVPTSSLAVTWAGWLGVVGTKTLSASVLSVSGGSLKPVVSASMSGSSIQYSTGSIAQLDATGTLRSAAMQAMSGSVSGARSDISGAAFALATGQLGTGQTISAATISGGTGTIRSTKSVAITGSSTTAAIGNVGATQHNPLVGTLSNMSIGSVVKAINVGLTGVVAYTQTDAQIGSGQSLGGQVANVSTGITGKLLATVLNGSTTAGAAGQVSAAGVTSIGGSVVIASQGSVAAGQKLGSQYTFALPGSLSTVTNDRVMVGVTSVVRAGSIKAAPLQSITGVDVGVVQAGSLAGVDKTATLSGAAISARQAKLTGDKLLALFGVDVTGEQGEIIEYRFDALEGEQIGAQAGSVQPLKHAVLGGGEITTEQGSPEARPYILDPQAAVASAGSLVGDSNITLRGQQIASNTAGVRARNKYIDFTGTDSNTPEDVSAGTRYERMISQRRKAIRKNEQYEDDLALIMSVADLVLSE